MKNETIKDWLLKQRLKNYGYDYKWFRRMQQTNQRYKNRIKNMPDMDVRKSLAQAGILGKGRRLTRQGGKVDYTTGQSFNEEYINMVTLAGTKGKKSFFQIQDKWFE
jgi:hypothetical protein